MILPPEVDRQESTSSKSWYEEEIDRLKDLVSRTKDTNTLLEKEEKNSYQKRIVNIQAAQAEIHKRRISSALRAYLIPPTKSSSLS